MSSDTTTLRKNRYFVLSSILGDARQRRLLSMLQSESYPMTDRDLAIQLAARELNRSPANVPERHYRDIRSVLHHHYLPKLESIGLIDRGSEGTVATQRFSLDGTKFSFPSLEEPEHPQWEAIAIVLARPHRLHIVSILDDHRQPLSLDALVSELDALAQSSLPRNEAWDEPGLTELLHHIDLPQLADAGLITYDNRTKTIIPAPDLASVLSMVDVDTA